jgi:hypothetical protein
MQMLQPLIDQANQAAAARSTAATNAINGATQSLVSGLAGIDFAAPATEAQGRQAAVDAALQQSLTGGGNALAQDLQSRLAVIGDPSVAATAQQVAAQGAGNGTTVLANGSANLGALIADAAAQSAYGLKQPGIARLAGLQQLAAAQNAISGDLGTQIQNILSQSPQLAMSLMANAQQQRTDAAKAAAEAAETTYQHGQDAIKNKRAANAAARATRQQNFQAGIALLSQTGKITPQIAKLLGVGGKSVGSTTVASRKAVADATNTAASIKERGTAAAASLKERVAHDTALEASAKRRNQLTAQRTEQAQKNSDRAYQLQLRKLNKPVQAKANATVSKALGYLADASGDAIKVNGKRVAIPTSTGSVKGPLGLNARDYQKYNSLALGAARNYHSTWQDKSGSDQDPLTWQQYLTAGEQAGIPIAILVAQGKKVYSAKERKQGLIPGG